MNQVKKLTGESVLVSGNKAYQSSTQVTEHFSTHKK